MDERMRFVIRLEDGESMPSLCRTRHPRTVFRIQATRSGLRCPHVQKLFPRNFIYCGKGSIL